MRFLPLLVCMWLTAPIANATIIDDFTDTLPNLLVNDANPVATDSQTGLSGVLGGNRVAEIRQQTPNQISSITPAQLAISGGSAYYSEGVGTDAIISLQYGDSVSPLNASFLGLNGFSLGLDYDTSPVNSIAVGIELTSGLGGVEVVASSLVNLTAEPVGGKLVFPFSEFAGIDFADVDRIVLTVDSLTGAPDTVLTGFTAIPEPSTIALSLLGIAAMIGYSRRR